MTVPPNTHDDLDKPANHGRAVRRLTVLARLVQIAYYTLRMLWQGC